MPEGFDPAEDDIEFVVSPSRKAHVVVPLLEEDLHVAGVPVEPEFAMLIALGKTLCGRRYSGREWVSTDVFPDRALCARCLSSMGEHSARLFDPYREDSW